MSTVELTAYGFQVRHNGTLRREVWAARFRAEAAARYLDAGREIPENLQAGHLAPA